MASRIGYYDRDGRFLYATPAMATLFGLTPDQVIGRTWYEIGVPPEVVDSLEALRRGVMATGEPARTHVSVVRNGRARETDIVIEPTFEESGAIAGTVVSGRDAGDAGTSSRGRARLQRTKEILTAVDEVLVRTEERKVILREVCRIAAEIGGFQMVWVGILDEATGDVNLAYKAGRDKGLLDTVKVSIRDEPNGRGTLGTAIRENRSSIVQDVASDRRMDPWRYVFDELQYRTAAAFPLRVHGRPIGALALYSVEAGHFDAAEARLFEQVADDVSHALTRIETERAMAAAQAAVAASEKRYRELFAVNPHPLAVIDVETLQFLEVNAAAVADYGYSREEFLAMTVLDLIPPGDVPAVKKSIDTYRDRPGLRTTGPWRQVLKDGSVIKVDVSGHRTTYNGRRARLLLAIDVTERERLQAQLTEIARLEAMGRLAGGIAHDFNNLLTAINGYADLLAAELDDDPKVESVREIRRAGTRAAELTRQILAFSRRLDSELRPVDVGALVDSISQMLGRLIGEDVRLVTSTDERPVVVRADPGRLEQILVNLAVNSRDAMPSGGELRIEVSRVADGAELGRPDISPAALIRVIDNGVGMDEATRSRVFEPFFTTKKPGEGTGLGLATVCSNVELFGGDVRVDSRPGEGTAVSIVLPVADAEPDGVILARLAERRPGPRATVLVAEDDQSVRALVVAILERAGHRVLVAGAPAEAVALADGLTDPIHVLLTDAVMPGGTGRDLATRLRASRPGLKVVLMSGYDIDGSREPEIDHTAFLAKPFSPEALLAAVESFELD